MHWPGASGGRKAGVAGGVLNFASSSRAASDFGGSPCCSPPILLEMEPTRALFRNLEDERMKMQRKRRTRKGTTRWKRDGMSMALSCHVEGVEVGEGGYCADCRKGHSYGLVSSQMVATVLDCCRSSRPDIERVSSVSSHGVERAGTVLHCPVLWYCGEV